MDKLRIQEQKILRIFLFLLFITSYELRVTSYECFAQDKIIAVVNNEVITQKDLNDFINFMRLQLSAEYNGQDLESKIQSMKLDLLYKLIDERLILQEAKKSNIKIDESRVRVRLEEIRKHYPLDTEFQNALTRQGLTRADIELKIKEQLLTYQIIDIKARSKIVVNPTEVTDFYEKNKGKFHTFEQREVSLITVDSESQAFEAFNKLKGKGDLNKIASEYSLEVKKISARQDGELTKDIEDTVFKLNLNEISSPVKVNDTFYIFKLDNIIMPRQKSLSESQEDIYAFLFDKKMQEAMSQWLGELKKHSYIKITQD